MWKRIIVGAFGGAFAGVGVFVIWPSVLYHLNWWGGFFAAGTIIPIAWFINHFCGAIPNDPEGSWVDMAFPIGLSAVFGGIVQVTKDGPVRAAHGIFTGGNPLPSMQTLAVQFVGACIGGLLAYWLLSAGKKEA
ncbi:Lin0368 family putative glycerol transporter subunit [Aminiphilus circumscriptus]|jgi:hypothetical protein|uniref:Lin0368 family putative glycerol transporter subunit n=1 Tax=Aminiphilus circumscriptus TaxID=290732 RepID=UPI0004924306|nr:hypothetical protein [Aminiphilus circumscriptus]